MTNPTKLPLCPVKTQISLGIRPFLMRFFAVRLNFAHSEDSGQRTLKTLDRLGGRQGWSETSLGAQVILLVLLCFGSLHILYFGLSSS